MASNESNSTNPDSPSDEPQRKKRKLDDLYDVFETMFQDLDKEQILAKLNDAKKMDTMREDLTCPICQSLCRFPFCFPCQQNHYGCHSCILDMIRHGSTKQRMRCYPIASNKMCITALSEWNCPLCNTQRSGLSSWALSDLFKPVPPTIRKLYDDHTETKCPHCPLVGNHDAVYGHLVRRLCPGIRIPCGYCQVELRLEQQDINRHLSKECLAIECSDCVNVRGSVETMWKHHQKHVQANKLAGTLRWMANFVQHHVNEGLLDKEQLTTDLNQSLRKFVYGAVASASAKQGEPLDKWVKKRFRTLWRILQNEPDNHDDHQDVVPLSSLPRLLDDDEEVSGLDSDVE